MFRRVPRQARKLRGIQRYLERIPIWPRGRGASALRRAAATIWMPRCRSRLPLSRKRALLVVQRRPKYRLLLLSFFCAPLPNGFSSWSGSCNTRSIGLMFTRSFGSSATSGTNPDRPAMIGVPNCDSSGVGSRDRRRPIRESFPRREAAKGRWLKSRCRLVRPLQHHLGCIPPPAHMG